MTQQMKDAIESMFNENLRTPILEVAKQFDVPVNELEKYYTVEMYARRNAEERK